MQGKEKHCERKFGGIFVDCDGKRIGRPSGSFPANGTRNPRFRPNASRRGPTSLDICLGNSPPPASDRFTGWSNARQIKAGRIFLPAAALLFFHGRGRNENALLPVTSFPVKSEGAVAKDSLSHGFATPAPSRREPDMTVSCEASLIEGGGIA